MSNKEPKFIKVLHLQAEGEMKTLQIKKDLQMFRALVGGHVAFTPLRMSKEEWKGWKHTAERLGVPHIKDTLRRCERRRTADGLADKQVPSTPRGKPCVG